MNRALQHTIKVVALKLDPGGSSVHGLQGATETNQEDLVRIQSWINEQAANDGKEYVIYFVQAPAPGPAFHTLSLHIVCHQKQKQES